MDAAANKALLRSRMREAAQRREKRIDSPLVRYNDQGQAVCKVCNVAIKSEVLWPAHLGSWQHKDAAEELKARAKGLGTSKPASQVPQQTTEEESKRPLQLSPQVPQATEPSALPADFFDTTLRVQPGGSEESLQPAADIPKASNGNVKHDEAKDIVKGAVPQGFFDNVDADMKARGLEPPKRDMQEELKEFQKSIEADLKEVDYRQVEEEFEAAEDRDEEDQIEQSICMERVQMFKKRKLALPEAKSKPVKDIDSLLAELSSEDESDEDSVMDWRAKQL